MNILSIEEFVLWLTKRNPLKCLVVDFTSELFARVDNFSLYAILVNVIKLYIYGKIVYNMVHFTNYRSCTHCPHSNTKYVLAGKSGHCLLQEAAAYMSTCKPDYAQKAVFLSTAEVSTKKLLTFNKSTK